MRFVFSNRKWLRGLVLRRTDERALFLAKNVRPFLSDTKGYKNLKFDVLATFPGYVIDF